MPGQRPVGPSDDLLHRPPGPDRERPAALRCWERLGESSAEFRAIQRRLAVFWGAGLLAEAAVRVGIVARFPVHTAAWLVNVAAVVIILLLCAATGPLGGVRLQRLLSAALADSQPHQQAS